MISSYIAAFVYTLNKLNSIYAKKSSYLILLCVDYMKFEHSWKCNVVCSYGRNVENIFQVNLFFFIQKKFVFVLFVHYEMQQHSHTISLSFVLCLRFISRTISANTSLTFVRCLALASTKAQPQIWAKA